MIQTRYRQSRASERRYAHGEILEGRSLLDEHDSRTDGESTPAPDIALSDDDPPSRSFPPNPVLKPIVLSQPSPRRAPDQAVDLYTPSPHPFEDTAQA